MSKKIKVGSDFSGVEAFEFMNVMIIDPDGTEREISIVQPLIDEVINAKLPYTTTGNAQLKIDF